jgi:hypothetical protein
VPLVPLVVVGQQPRGKDASRACPEPDAINAYVTSSCEAQ